ncbi:hypothetical protein [Phenylobacterium sp.]|uniref:hypothetical protein n=1 Tax=Phenylobacterium sp. TaxID=1871053 RepID=UPI002ED9B6AF
MTDRKQKLAAIDAALTGMFGKLEERGVPEHIQSVVDQLDDEDVRPCPESPSSPEP